jgi:hypothetical protein
MNHEVESHIQKNCPWTKLPQNVKQVRMDETNSVFDRYSDMFCIPSY